MRFVSVWSGVRSPVGALLLVMSGSDQKGPPIISLPVDTTEGAASRRLLLSGSNRIRAGVARCGPVGAGVGRWGWREA